MRIIVIFLFLTSCANLAMAKDQFQLKSRSFKNNELIPQSFTCDGKHLSPELEWVNPPLNTKSFVLVMEDRDASNSIFVHWIIYNLPANISKIEEDIKILPAPAVLGENSSNVKSYLSPCPTYGTHRYYFRLYALDSFLDPKIEVNSTNLAKVIRNQLIDETHLIVKYELKLKKSIK